MWCLRPPTLSNKGDQLLTRSIASRESWSGEMDVRAMVTSGLGSFLAKGFRDGFQGDEMLYILIMVTKVQTFINTLWIELSRIVHFTV